MTTIETNDEELDVNYTDEDFNDEELEEYDELDGDDEEPGYCPHCSGSGEGSHDGAICGYCKGSGVERDDSEREDYEASRADQINDERKLSGEWE